MGLEIKVEVIHKETIKPSSPTPAHLKTTNLSVLDQLVPDVYVPILLFYPGNNADNIDLHSLVSERSKLLKSSLSKILTHFYPFAGKFERNDSICCNDHGAAFLEAQVNSPMSKILDKPDFGMLKKLLPAVMESRGTDKSYLVQVQANFFECGGIAIALCITHKATDASTLVNFISSWATLALGTARTADNVVLPPADFCGAASLLPPVDFLNGPLPSVENTENCVDASKIAALKSEAATASVPKPTRVEVVSAFIWKCAREASRSRSKLGAMRPSAWIPMVNLRKILAPTIGRNLSGEIFRAHCSKGPRKSELDKDIQNLVAILRKGIEEFKVKFTNGFNGHDACGLFQQYVSLMGSDADTYSCSSWCRFPLYAVDFRWGKPSWVSQCMEFTNTVVLTDTRDGLNAVLYTALDNVPNRTPMLRIYCTSAPRCMRNLCVIK